MSTEDKIYIWNTVLGIGGLWAFITIMLTTLGILLIGRI